MAAGEAESVARALPGSYPVAVVMERRGTGSPWAEETSEAVGIVVGREVVGEARENPLKIHEKEGVAHYLHCGFRLRLYEDECESYYHNLMTLRPRCFVVARRGANEVPEPFLVSLSFDEAHAYLEAGDSVYAVDMPPEIYRWCEAFVLARYVPERKYKRRLVHETPGGGG